ncbi:hypothetical protein EMIHUDRAFT_364329 [Emiliania huxleyi CCMP1516]|uniref:PAS domain-containing protein n=2 Tax=Emiliania huxleyi TaxID=2903 RepID=A0A0D3KAC8_EMIH1|nr:hypothetical protein EMIHUDRAFT_364329 [Emiliania huxleyi CCMP1516]EOD32713.1 hypothetical protein EMIHUDRAFT_364329 [Emiliania huxleyi CCMP1516]|eukprot:XP_005785142.1 hypothetical protein EMIHUDRAFT_364329 [Emiliania huxleyi CCMP1516]
MASIVLDQGERIVAVNSAWTRLCGFSANEALGSSPKLLQGPKTDTREARAFAEACRLGSASTTLTNYRKDGSPFTHRIRSRRVLDASGRVYYLSEGREVHGGPAGR